MVILLVVISVHSPTSLHSAEYRLVGLLVVYYVET